MAKRTVDALRHEFAQDLAHEKVEHIKVDSTVAIVTVVGQNMRGIPEWSAERSAPWPGECECHRHRAGFIGVQHLLCGGQERHEGGAGRYPPRIPTGRKGIHPRFRQEARTVSLRGVTSPNQLVRTQIEHDLSKHTRPIALSNCNKPLESTSPSMNPYLCIAPDVKLGRDVKLSKFINLYGCEVGDETKIGAFVEIQKNATVGKRCKISSHTFICEGVTIEDNVFIGHGVMFINDSYPRATAADGNLQTEADWKVERTVIKKGASIGSGATILSSITIGENAIVGAGSVVTKDVPPNSIVAGNPARVLRYIEQIVEVTE